MFCGGSEVIAGILNHLSLTELVIQMSTRPAQWKYVSTKLNLADYLTRGVKLLQLAELDTWWSGPHFLHNDEKVWLKCVIEQNPLYATEEAKRSILVSSNFRRLHSCNCVTVVNTNLVEDENCRYVVTREVF